MEKRRRIPRERPRDRERGEALAEDGDEPERRIVEGVDRPLERTTQRVEEAQLVETPIPVRRQAVELTQDPLARRPADEGCGLAYQSLGPLVHAEAELALEPHRSQQPQRIVHEDRVRNGPDNASVQVGAAAVRIAVLAAVDRHRHRVEGEVSRREIRVDPVRQRREVDRLLRSGRRDAPRAVAIGQRKRRAAEPLREAVSSIARVRARDVDVDERSSEKPVPDRAADDPGLLARQDLGDPLIHRDHPPRPARRRHDARRDLVSDRAGDARVLLDRDAVADDRHRRLGRQLPTQIDRDRVHRHGADHRPRLALDDDARAAQIPAEPVRVADRHDPDPRLMLGDEAASVARALTGRQPLDERDVGLPAKRRLEPVVGRIAPEGRDAVQRNSAAHRVEA